MWTWVHEREGLAALNAEPPINDPAEGAKRGPRRSEKQVLPTPLNCGYSKLKPLNYNIRTRTGWVSGIQKTTMMRSKQSNACEELVKARDDLIHRRAPWSDFNVNGSKQA